MRFRVFAGGNTGFIWESSSESPLMSLTSTGNLIVSGTATLGATQVVGALAVNDGSNTGVNRGIRLYNMTDSNWGLYMAPSGGQGGRSMGGSPACSGLNLASNAVRMRVFAGTDTGFIWENSNETTLMSLHGSNANFVFLATSTPGV